MLSNNSALCKTILNKYNIVFSMHFFSYCHRFHVRMLKTFEHKVFHYLVFANLPLSDAALQYRIAGQAGALLTLWCQLLTLQVGVEIKTPQTLTGKRKWCD
jgi:hypothetical protein